MNAAIKSFPVLAGAYSSKNPKSFLTHACEVDAEGLAQSVLCNRVKFDSICPDECMGESAAPTCEACAKALAKRKG